MLLCRSLILLAALIAAFDPPTQLADLADAAAWRVGDGMPLLAFVEGPARRVEARTQYYIVPRFFQRAGVPVGHQAVFGPSATAAAVPPYCDVAETVPTPAKLARDFYSVIEGCVHPTVAWRMGATAKDTGRGGGGVFALEMSALEAALAEASLDRGCSQVEAGQATQQLCANQGLFGRSAFLLGGLTCAFGLLLLPKGREFARLLAREEDARWRNRAKGYWGSL
ncbi:unnamed protein product, partial [Mesorhabditis spiculigera]